MNVHVMKTEAEETLGAQFEKLAARLPGTDWLAEERVKAISEFATTGLPNRRVEEWKYTDLRNRFIRAFEPSDGRHVGASWQAIEVALGGLVSFESARVVFVDGAFAPELSNSDDVGDGIEIVALGEALGAPPDWLKQTLGKVNVPSKADATVTLNTAFMTDGVAVRVGDGARGSKPLLIVNVATGEAERSITTRNVVVLGDRSQLTVVEAHLTLDSAATQSNTVTELLVGDDANITHIKMQGENLASQHLGTWMIRLGAHATYRALQVTTGGALTRNQLYLKFAGEGATAHINGAFLQRHKQHCDTTMLVDHAVPGCTSRELFKAVIDDEARGVFQGKIVVQPQAQKTDGKQMSQALLLSQTAEFDAKPELEIFADDVVCGHGATSGQIDEDMLFYLRARGVPEEIAKSLLIQAFVGEALDIVEDEGIREALTKVTEHWLARTD